MKIMNSKKSMIDTSSSDDFLYNRMIKLLQEIKLVRGANELSFTLRNHPTIYNYLTSKQISFLSDIENDFFLDDGSLNTLAIQNHSLHKL